MSVKFDEMNVMMFGASGSAQTTTGSITSGTNILTVASAIDFVVGQGISGLGTAEVSSLSVTAACSTAANCTVTLDGVDYPIALALTDSTAVLVATKIRAAYYKGWVAGGSGTTVTFTSIGIGARIDSVYSAGSTGATGTMTTSTPGVWSLITTITGISGTTITLSATATSTYTNVLVSHDDTVAIQAGITATTNSSATLRFPTGTYQISSLKMRLPSITQGSGTSDSCLTIPSNCNMKFDIGSKLILASGAPSWTRMVVIDTGVSNVTMTGFMELDGSSQSVTTGNEQMAGLFIFSATNIYIEYLYSHNTYGDNIYIGGSEANPSSSIKIDYFRGIKAGRRNFVIGFVDQLHVVTAIMDNTTGGTWESSAHTISPDFSGYYCLDLEPDSFAATRTFYQRFDYMSTTGQGNSMSTGTSDACAKAWVFDVGTWDMRVVKGGSIVNAALLQYAVTFRCDKLYIRSTDNLEATAYQTNYASYSDIGSLYIEGFNGQAMLLQSGTATQKLRMNIRSLRIDGKSLSNSEGIRIEGANLHIGTYHTVGIVGPILDIFSTLNNCPIVIDNIVSTDCGTSKIIFISQSGANNVVCHLNNINIFDSRGGSAATRIVEYETIPAMAGTTIGTIHNPNSILEFATSYGNFNPVLKLAGGDKSPAWYIITGAPEGSLTAPIGSMVTRTDGSAATTLYVKQSGAGNTGWVAMGASTAPTAITDVSGATISRSVSGVPWKPVLSDTGTVTWTFGGLAYDLFDRGDSNVTLGSAIVGGAWTAVSSTWGITTNAGYSVSDSQSDKALLPTVGTGNYTVSCSLKGTINNLSVYRILALVFRYVDGNNFLRLYLVNGQVILTKQDAGTDSNLGTASATTTDGTYYNLKAVCTSTSISVYVDNVLKFTYTLTVGEQTKYGSAGITGVRLAISGAPATAAAMNNFIIE